MIRSPSVRLLHAIWLALLAAVLALGLPAAPSWAAPETSPSFQLHVRVTDACTGRPIGGAEVTLRATVTAVEKRRVTFAVEAHDEKEKIGEGTHERFIVDVARFAERLAAKAAAK